MAEMRSEQKTLEQINAALAELSRASSLEAAGRTVAKYRELLISESTISLLERVIAAKTSEGDDDSEAFFRSTHDLLMRCRAIGIGEALAEIAAEEQFQERIMLAFDAHDRFSQNGKISELEEAISLFRGLCASAHWARTTSEKKAMIWGQLIGWQSTLYVSSEREDALYEARALSERALAEIGSEIEAHPFCAINAAGVELICYERDSKIVHLNCAIELLGNALNGQSLDVKKFAGGFLNLARALHLRYDKTGDSHDLDGAIDVLERASGKIDPDDPESSPIRDRLGTLLVLRFRNSRSSHDLEKISALYGDTMKRNEIISMAEESASQFLTNHSVADLDLAIDLYERGLDAITELNEEYSRVANNLAAAYGSRFDITRNVADLDNAITWRERVYAHGAVSPEAHLYYGVHLGQILVHRYQVSGNSADLERGIDLLEQAIEQTHQNSTHLHEYENALAIALDLRSKRTSNQRDADRSVELWEKAVDGLEIGSADWCGYLGNFCRSLTDRSHTTKSQNDIGRALDVSERLIESMPPRHPLYLSFLSVLGSAIRDYVSVVRNFSRATAALHAWRLGCERLDTASREARREAFRLSVDTMPNRSRVLDAP